MKLLIIRHADAGDPDAWTDAGRADSERPLSEKGRNQFTKAAKTLVELVPDIGLVAVSPYVRARQTAKLLLDLLPLSKEEITESLVPEAEPEDFVRWLNKGRPSEVVAVVGHEPHLSLLATWLIAGLDESRITLKKGGACLITFDKSAARGEGTLEWLLGRRQLK